MKRWFVLFLAAFTFLVAPHIQGLRTPLDQPRPAVVAASSPPPDIDEQLKHLLQSLDEPDEPKAPTKIERPKLKPGEHWVPVIRFTNASIDKANVAKVVSLFEQISAAGPDAIVLELSTLGGEVPSGYEFARAIERSNAHVTCVVDGDAASMGYFVLQSCDTRLMTKRSVLMIHEPHVGGPDHGTQSVYRNLQAMLHITSEAMLEHEVVRMKVSKEVVRKHIENGQDWNMLYGEALEVGAVDGVAPSVESVVRTLIKNPHAKF
jgi:ATP-dependent protease ClpP protease subunit